MPKISEKPLKIIQVRIFDEDDKRLDALCSAKLSKNRLIRTIIHTYLGSIEATIDKQIDKLEETHAARPSQQ